VISEAHGGGEVPGAGGRRAISVLLIEDSRDDAELLLRELARCGYEVDHLRVETAAALRTALAERAWDIILSDFNLPTLDALRALALVEETRIDIPFIIVSGTIGEESAVAALKAGAHDFIAKSQLARLRPAIDRELREAEIRASRRLAEEAFRASEERFRAIMETATEAVVATDDEGRISYVNPAAEGMFGYPAAELIGGPIYRLMPERFRASCHAGLARFHATGQARVVGRKVELVGLRADATELSRSASASRPSS
jgi:PAS domain S-box-containing protein